MTFPDHINEPDFRDNYRYIGKTCLIAKIYGRGNAGLAELCECDVSLIDKMEKALFSNWANVARMKDHKILYTRETGCAETYLGDRLNSKKDQYFTVGVNHPTQGNAACILMEGFENSILNIRGMGIDIYSETVIHDSNTNMIKVRDLPEVDLAYQRYFRKYIKEKYGIDYKFDLDIMINFRDKIKYKFNPSKREMSFSGYESDIDYILRYMQEGRDITVLSREYSTEDKTHYEEYMRYPYYRAHMLCTLPEFNSMKKESLVIRINDPIIGEDLIDKPLGEPYYFDKVKKWYEHPLPGFEKEEPEGIKDNPNKVYPVDLMNKILAERG